MPFSSHCLTSASLDLIDPRTHPFVYHRLQAAMVSVDACPITQCVRTYIPRTCTYTVFMHVLVYAMYCMYVRVCRRNSFKHCLCLPPCSQTPQVPTTGGSPCEYSGSDTVHSDSVKLIAAVSNFGLCSLHRMKMVAKLGSLTQRVQTLSSASTLVYSQLSLLQLSRAAASGRYMYCICTPTHAQYTSLTVLLAAHMHACVHRCKLSSWPHGHRCTV